jgi:RNA-dependent RNA polymerase
MTDGCGYMNIAALTAIYKRMGYETCHSAYQARVVGSKGIWELAPPGSDDNLDPRIYITASQRKVYLPIDKLSNEGIDRAHLIFNLVAPARLTTPSRLSMLSIMNLAHNGVPHEVLRDLLKASLDERIKPLIQFDGHRPTSRVLLIKAIEDAGGVSGARARRLFAGLARAMGFGQRFSKDEEEDDDGVTWCDDGGTPISLYEKILALLYAGFWPTEHPTVFEEFQNMLTQVVTRATREYHLVMPRSLEAFVICGK